MENNVKVLKLITGEEVITRVIRRDAGSLTGLITLNKPMLIQMIPTKQGESWSATLIPWLKTTKSEKVTISTEYVLVTDEASDQTEKNYLQVITGLTL